MDTDHPQNAMTKQVPSREKMNNPHVAVQAHPGQALLAEQTNSRKELATTTKGFLIKGVVLIEWFSKNRPA